MGVSGADGDVGAGRGAEGLDSAGSLLAAESAGDPVVFRGGGLWSLGNLLYYGGQAGGWGGKVARSIPQAHGPKEQEWTEHCQSRVASSSPSLSCSFFQRQLAFLYPCREP